MAAGDVNRAVAGNRAGGRTPVAPRDAGLIVANRAIAVGVADTGHVSGKSQAGNRRGGQLRSGGHQAALDVGVARRRCRGAVAVDDRRGNGVITLLGIGVVAENLEPAGNHAAGTRAIAPMDGGGIHAGIPVPIAVGKVGNVQVAGGQVGRVVEIDAAGGDPAGRDLSRGGDAAAAVIGCRDYGRIRAALRVSVRAIDVKGRSGTTDRARRGLPIPPRNRRGIIRGGSVGIGVGESDQGIGEGDARRSAHRILVLERERRVGDRGRAADGEVRAVGIVDGCCHRVAACAEVRVRAAHGKGIRSCDRRGGLGVITPIDGRRIERRVLVPIAIGEAPNRAGELSSLDGVDRRVLAHQRTGRRRRGDADVERAGEAGAAAARVRHRHGHGISRVFRIAVRTVDGELAVAAGHDARRGAPIAPLDGAHELAGGRLEIGVRERAHHVGVGSQRRLIDHTAAGEGNGGDLGRSADDGRCAVRIGDDRLDCVGTRCLIGMGARGLEAAGTAALNDRAAGAVAIAPTDRGLVRRGAGGAGCERAREDAGERFPFDGVERRSLRDRCASGRGGLGRG